MKLLISTGTFRKFNFTFKEIFEISKDIGFDGVELFLGHPDNIKKIDFDEIKKISQMLSLPIYNLHFPSYEIYLWKYILSQGYIAKKVILQSWDIAQKLQVENFVVHPLPTLYFRWLFKKNMKKILNLLPRKNTKIAIEIMPSVKLGHITVLPHMIKYPNEFNAFCKENKINMTLDITHCKDISVSPTDAFLKCKDIIVNIHLSDWAGKNKQHLPIGWGKINFEEFFEVLKENNYNKFITLEIVSEYFDDIKVIKESYQKCRELMGK